VWPPRQPFIKKERARPTCKWGMKTGMNLHREIIGQLEGMFPENNFPELQ
jgi:hypothetical protein